MGDNSDSKPEKTESELTGEKSLEPIQLTLQNPKRIRNWQQQMPLEMADDYEIKRIIQKCA